MTLENYISEAVSHGRRHAMIMLASYMKIDDLISALDSNGFQQKTVPVTRATGAMAVSLFSEAKKNNRRMYFVNREIPFIWAVLPEHDIAYNFVFSHTKSSMSDVISELGIYSPVVNWTRTSSKNGSSKNEYYIEYLSNIESFHDKKGIETALEDLNNILYH